MEVEGEGQEEVHVRKNFPLQEVLGAFYQGKPVEEGTTFRLAEGVVVKFSKEFKPQVVRRGTTRNCISEPRFA